VVYRRAVILVLLFTVGLQSFEVGYAASLGMSWNTADAAPTDTVNPAPPGSHGHSDCCPQHSKHAGVTSCIAHCAAMVAVVAPMPVSSTDTGRQRPDRAPTSSFLSKDSAPQLRPPIV
jgi:hypothetical protein